MSTCQFCDISVKDKYSLKNHLVRNKKCLKIRGLTLNTNFICKGCENTYSSNANLVIHIETCKEYIILKVREECKVEYDKQIQEKNNEIDKLLLDTKSEYCTQINKLKEQLKEKNSEHENLKKSSDKAIQTLQKMLENIAIKAVDKPTTTNTTINNIRNSFSDKYFVEDIKEEDIKRKCQSYLTEQVLLDGQRGIAKMCTEHIINTKDKKKLLISTDPSRNKFRYMDKNGNMKDDIDARTFIEKISKPIKEVADIVFDCVISDIKDEQDNIEDDNYSRKAFLHDKEMQANHSLVYIKCFDDPKHNSEFTNELAVLNKNK